MSSQNSALTILIIAAIIFGIVGISLVLGHFANGQTTTGQQVQQVQEQVQQNAQQIDTTTLVAGGTAAGTIATFLANYLKTKKLDSSDKRTDRDIGLSLLYFYRLIQTMDAMIPAVSKCLDQPFSSDNMQRHITIRMKLADDANSTADYLKTSLNAAVPSMTPAASVIVAEATQQTQSPPIKEVPPNPLTPPKVEENKTA